MENRTGAITLGSYTKQTVTSQHALDEPDPPTDLVDWEGVDVLQALVNHPGYVGQGGGIVALGYVGR